MAEIYKRIQQFMDVQNLKPATLAQLLKEKTQRIKDILSGKQRAPEDVLIKIVEIFNLNGTWLLTGQGEMYNNVPNAPLPKLKGKTVKEIDEHLKKLKPEQKEHIFRQTFEMIRVNEIEDQLKGLLKEKEEREREKG